MKEALSILLFVQQQRNAKWSLLHYPQPSKPFLISPWINFNVDVLFLFFVTAIMDFVAIAIQNRFYTSQCARRTNFRRPTVTAAELILEKKRNPIWLKSLQLAVERTQLLISAWILHFSCLLCAFGNYLYTISCNRYFRIMNWK